MGFAGVRVRRLGNLFKAEAQCTLGNGGGAV